jgi:anaphase-promoting complex subunit 8
MAELDTDRQQLRRAVAECRERRLIESAKWAAQQLVGLPADPAASEAPSPVIATAALTAAEEDAYQLALSYFDFREYMSAAYALRPFLINGSLKTHFMHAYCLYLSTEKQRAEHKNQPAGLAASTGRREKLKEIESRIWKIGDAADGFLLHILGLARIALDDELGARDALLRSVKAYPCNWSAWKALQSICPDYETAAALNLPEHFSSHFFRATLCLQMQRPKEALETLRSLAVRFPSADSLLLNAALAHSNMQNYDEAQQLFEGLLESNPHRIEGMDVYSNILYVKEATVHLSAVARRCVEEDPYRPETCCVAGNYYSLRGQHEKAVVYFRRALRLDPSYLPAWTLMGHEYVELKNPPAGIEAYHRAVGLNPRDYRAWYGLGQTYELVNMPHHALHYYRKAVALRPEDARMWNAMAHCYASSALNQPEAAVECYRRALPNDKEGVALHQLALLHQQLGRREEASHYYKMNLEQVEAAGLAESSDAVQALQFLADYHQAAGQLEEASRYYERLLDYGVPKQREAAKASLLQIQEALARARAGGGAAASPAALMLATPGSDDMMGMTPTPPR